MRSIWPRPAKTVWMDDSRRRAECAVVRTPKTLPSAVLPPPRPPSPTNSLRFHPVWTKSTDRRSAGWLSLPPLRISFPGRAGGSRRRDEGGRRRERRGAVQRSRPVSVGACCWVQPARAGWLRPDTTSAGRCSRPPRALTTAGCYLPAVRGASQGPSGTRSIPTLVVRPFENRASRQP